MEVDTIISDASGSESAEQNSKLITPANTIEGKSIEEFTKVSVSAKEINIYHRYNILFRSVLVKLLRQPS